MKLLTLIALFLTLGFSGFSQVAKSYYHKNILANISPVYFDKHPSENAYFSASTRIKGSSAELVLTKLLYSGETVFHTVIDLDVPLFINHSATDIITNETSIYVGTLLFNGSNYDFLIHQFDFDGNLINSVEIDSDAGFKAPKSQLNFNAEGNLCFALVDATNDADFYIYNVSDLSEISKTSIGTTSFVEIHNYRLIHLEQSGENTVVIYQRSSEMGFYELSPEGTVLNSFSLDIEDKQITDLEIVDGEYVILLNYVGASTAAENPLHIARIDPEGEILSEEIYEVSNLAIFENFAIDESGDIFVCSRAPLFYEAPGTILKISEGSLVYEVLSDGIDGAEIELNGDHIVISGSTKKSLSHCSNEENNGGNVFFRNRKSDPTMEFQLVSPIMTMKQGLFEVIVSSGSNNFNVTHTHESGFSVASTNTIFNSALCLSAENGSGDPIAAADKTRNPFAEGPVMDPVFYTQIEKDKWHRVWVITREQIDNHIDAFIAGDPLYETPEVILHWPGNGNPEKGQAAQLAPYKDVNGNGIYEPLLGEYPLIKGDFCSLSIYNDVIADETVSCLTADERMGVEVYEYVYGFLCAEDPALRKSLFVHYDIINRSGETFSNTRVGNFTDVDVLLTEGDYIGTDPLRGLVYSTQPATPDTEPNTSQGYVILGSKANADGEDNSVGIAEGQSPNGIGYGNGIIDDERLGMTHAYVNPFIPFGVATSENYYNLMQSINIEGDHLEYGGTGFEGTSGIPANFHFPGSSDDLFYGTYGVDPGFSWSEEEEGFPSGDRYFIATSGSFDLLSDDTLHFDVAYITSFLDDADELSTLETLESYVDDAREYYIEGSTPCETDFDFYEPFDGPYETLSLPKDQLHQFTLYPNPSSASVRIKGFSETAEITVYNLNGQVLYTNPNVNSDEEIDVSELPKGVYIVKITADNAVEHLQFVKQ